MRGAARLMALASTHEQGRGFRGIRTPCRFQVRALKGKRSGGARRGTREGSVQVRMRRWQDQREKDRVNTYVASVARGGWQISQEQEQEQEQAQSQLEQQADSEGAVVSSTPRCVSRPKYPCAPAVSSIGCVARAHSRGRGEIT